MPTQAGIAMIAPAFRPGATLAEVLALRWYELPDRGERLAFSLERDVTHRNGYPARRRSDAKKRSCRRSGITS
jgi:hypothetical protein